MPEGKDRIRIKTQRRRRYNSVVDGRARIPESVREYMHRKPYSTDGGSKDGPNTK